MGDEFANLNLCAVLFLSRAAVNLNWCDSTYYYIIASNKALTVYNCPAQLIQVLGISIHFSQSDITYGGKIRAMYSVKWSHWTFPYIALNRLP